MTRLCTRRHRNAANGEGTVTMDALLTRPPGTQPDGALAAPAHTPAEFVADFGCCYRQQFPGLVWFVMGLGAGAEEAADAAQSAFAAAFPAWE
ncbi:MAG: hypothetical protein J2P32_17730, partial [Actinobacteria bacterium]|nr:hypothetical protein [Actinomycetota bacterium]